MAENQNTNNQHILEFLDYYCGMSHPPKYAVMLKGLWGNGKTWFIKKFIEEFDQNYKPSEKPNKFLARLKKKQFLHNNNCDHKNRND